MNIVANSSITRMLVGTCKMIISLHFSFNTYNSNYNLKLVLRREVLSLYTCVLRQDLYKFPNFLDPTLDHYSL